MVKKKGFANLIVPVLEMFPAELQLQDGSVPLRLRRLLKQQKWAPEDTADPAKAEHFLLPGWAEEDQKNQNVTTGQLQPNDRANSEHCPFLSGANSLDFSVRSSQFDGTQRYSP